MNYRKAYFDTPQQKSGLDINMNQLKSPSFMILRCFNI